MRQPYTPSGAIRIDAWRASRPLERPLAQEVLLADVDAVVAKDRVRGRVVEVEVGQRVVVEVVAAAHPLAVPAREGDVPLLGAGELLAIEALQVRDDRRDAGA